MEMFDSMLEKAKALMEAAGKKTGEVVEVSKLKVNSIQINSEIKGCYERLGSAVYSMMKADYENPELMASMVSEIDDLFEKLDDNNAKISELKNVTICDCCGAKNPAESVYCAKCGNKLAKEEQGKDCDCKEEPAQAQERINTEE